MSNSPDVMRPNAKLSTEGKIVPHLDPYYISTDIRHFSQVIRHELSIEGGMDFNFPSTSSPMMTTTSTEVPIVDTIVDLADTMTMIDVNDQPETTIETNITAPELMVISEILFPEPSTALQGFIRHQVGFSLKVRDRKASADQLCFCPFP